MTRHHPLDITTRTTRADIEAEIARLNAKYHRMPVHWEARRLGLMRDIEALVDEWLTLG